MKKALRIFVFCLLLIAYAVIYAAYFFVFMIIKILSFVHQGLEWALGIILKSIHEKRGNLKGG